MFVDVAERFPIVRRVSFFVFSFFYFFERFLELNIFWFIPNHGAEKVVIGSRLRILGSRWGNVFDLCGVLVFMG